MSKTQTEIDNIVDSTLAPLAGVKLEWPGGKLRGECTVPVQRYYVPAITGQAAPYMANDRADGWGVAPPASLLPFFDIQRFEAGRAYPKGTIMMWDSPHIAVLAENYDGGTYGTFWEQNADPEGSPFGRHVRGINISHHANYVAIPKVSVPAPAPTPTPQPVQAAPAAGYHLVVEVAGYLTSNGAANHIDPHGTVPAGDYVVFNEAHGMVNISRVSGQPGWWINPSDNVVPTPAPAPVVAPPAQEVTVVPAPAIEQAPAAPPVTYSKLDAPMDLVLNKDSQEIAIANEAGVNPLANGTPFRAYGKAQRNDGDKTCYFLTEADFGQADITGAPARDVGINTADLSPAPKVSDLPQDTTPDNGEVIPVTVIPSPAKPWQSTYKKYLSPVDYVAIATVLVPDLDNPDAPKQYIIKEQIKAIVGEFTGPDGKTKYYRTIASVAGNNWRGIPQTAMERKDEIEKDNFVDKALHEATHIRQELGKFTRHERTVIRAAKIDNFVTKIFKRR
jgi:hypothetical protein